MSARWSAHASTIFAGFGSSDSTSTLIPGGVCSRLDYCNAVLYGLPQSTIGPLQERAERRCVGHTWSVNARPCPSGAEGAPLAASRLSYSVQGRAFDVYGK